MSDHDAFDVLDVPVQSIDYAGTTITIQPLTVGQLPAFSRHVRPALSSFLALDSAMEPGNGEVALADLFLELIGEHGDSLQEALSVATGLPLAVIRSGSLPDFVNLAKEVVRINRDFFARSLAQAAADRRRPIAPGAGQTLSNH